MLMMNLVRKLMRMYLCVRDANIKEAKHDKGLEKREYYCDPSMEFRFLVKLVFIVYF